MPRRTCRGIFSGIGSSPEALGYLAASGHPLGLLMNFNNPVLEQGIRRVIPWRTPPR